MDLKYEIGVTVKKPVKAVFEAVAKGSTLSRYFPDASTGDLASGAAVRWTFRDGDSIDVKVTKFVPDERIEISWRGAKVKYDVQAAIQFDEHRKGTRVSVFESGWHEDQAGVTGSYEHCAGWMHMLQCLKAWVEFGIDLRS